MSTEAAQSIPGPVTIRLAIALALVMGLFALVDQSRVLQGLFEPWNLALARATEMLLELMDVPVDRHATVLAHPGGFSYRIDYVCSGFRPVTLIAVTLLTVPATWLSRVVGFGVAVGAVAALNLFRLVHLYTTGVADESAFIMAHRVTWNIIAILAVVGFLAIWLYLTRRPARRESIHLSECHGNS